MTINNGSPIRTVPSSPSSSPKNPTISPQNQSKFERSLQRQEDREARSQKPDKPATARHEDGRTEPKKNKGDADHKNGDAEKKRARDANVELFAWSGAVQSSGSFQGGGEMATGGAQAGQMDMELKAQIDRIAAAIAEQAQRGQQSQFTVQLPGGLPIESAILARSATGYVSIFLVARPGALGLNDRKLLRRELQDRLEQKPIKLAEISFTGKSG